MPSALNVDSLPEYINGRQDELLTKAVLGATTLKYVSIMPNVKYKDSLISLRTNVEFKDGTQCGWDPAGDTILSDRTIEVSPVKVNKEYCYAELNKTALNHQLLFQAGRETLPFEEKFIDSAVAATAAQLEIDIWQASKGTDMKLFTGFLPRVLTGDDATAVTKITINPGSEGRDIVDRIYDSLNESTLLSGAAIFVSPTTFRSFVKGLNETCCANRAVIDAANQELVYPGDSRVTVISTPGLENAPALGLGTWKNNLIYGTDIEDSQNAFKFWYSDDQDTFRLKILFNAGTQIAFPDDVVVAVRA